MPAANVCIGVDQTCSIVDHDLMAVLRAGAYDRAIEDALLDATWVEPAGHAIAAPPFVQPD